MAPELVVLAAHPRGLFPDDFYSCPSSSEFFPDFFLLSRLLPCPVLVDTGFRTRFIPAAHYPGFPRTLAFAPSCNHFLTETYPLNASVFELAIQRD